ncbi:hypothetical protein ACFXJ5_05015 [Streptomyces sp. NPDC059373]
MYSWATREEAEAYAERLRGRGTDVDILTFHVSDSDFSSLKKADVVAMSPGEADAFMERHSRLYGAGEPHDYEYVKDRTGMGHEHYFAKSVFHKLKFAN